MGAGPRDAGLSLSKTNSMESPRVLFCVRVNNYSVDAPHAPRQRTSENGRSVQASSGQLLACVFSPLSLEFSARVKKESWWLRGVMECVALALVRGPVPCVCRRAATSKLTMPGFIFMYLSYDGWRRRGPALPMWRRRGRPACSVPPPPRRSPATKKEPRK